MNQNQIPIKTTCNACGGEGVLATGKGTLLTWVDVHQLAKMLHAIAAEEQARLAAEAIGSRRFLWQILSAMAEIESDHEKSVSLKTQARDNIQFIADHIRSDELRSLFLQSQAVKTLIT